MQPAASHGTDCRARHPREAGALATLAVPSLKSRGFAGVTVLAGVADGTAHLTVAVGEAHTKQFQAGKLIGQLAPLVGGKGGGRPDLARGAGKDPSGLDALLAKARELIA